MNTLCSSLSGNLISRIGSERLKRKLEYLLDNGMHRNSFQEQEKDGNQASRYQNALSTIWKLSAKQSLKCDAFKPVFKPKPSTAEYGEDDDMLFSSAETDKSASKLSDVDFLIF
jgi:hypothetical protein